MIKLYLSNNIERLDVRMVGEDHKGKPFTGDDLNLKVIFNSRTHNYSTTNSIKQIIKLELYYIYAQVFLSINGV